MSMSEATPLSVQTTPLQAKNGKIDAAISVLSHYLHGKEKALRLALTCFFSNGHLLIEDLPGLGKTTLAIAIAKVLGLTFGRIQCTSDLLPSDITGLSIYNKNLNAFEFQQGPIFNHIVLFDEINRATPKTQSALLEAMGEKQVTIEGRTYNLPRPFFVIATQNPTEQFGTFPLPESQLDRFMMKISIGYPVRSAEKEILKGGSKRKEIYSIEPVMDSRRAGSGVLVRRGCGGRRLRCFETRSRATAPGGQPDGSDLDGRRLDGGRSLHRYGGRRGGRCQALLLPVWVRPAAGILIYLRN